MTVSDIGVVILRLGIAWVFLNAAWLNTRDEDARRWTCGETALLFLPKKLAPDDPLVRAAMIAGMAMMYSGGAAILTGILPRLGGLAIAVFSLMGMRIHSVRRSEALVAANAGDAMGWSAFSAHTAARLKNWALAAAGLYFACAGTGTWSIGPDVGATLAERLLG